MYLTDKKQIIEKKMILITEYSRILFRILLFGVLLFHLVGTGTKASASSASISIQSKNEQIVKGDTVYIVITVSSMDEIYGFEGSFSYDNRYLRFVSGGKLVHGNDDEFKIQDLERAAGTNKITYSVKFKARKAGGIAIELKKPYHVLGKNMDKMSVSYNGKFLYINEKGTATQEAVPTAENQTPPQAENPPQQNEKPEPSEKPPAETSQAPEEQRKHKKNDVIGSVKLRKLSIQGAELAPDFSPDIKKYSGTLTTSDTIATIDYEPEDSFAEISIKGNDRLVSGRNVIKVVVKNGAEKRTYRFSLNVRFSDALERDTANKVTAFRNGSRLYLIGDKTIETGEAGDEMKIPDGYEKIITQIDGEEITAYSLNGESEQNYILLYAENEKIFYLYDRENEWLLPYEQVKNWYRSMGAADLSEAEAAEAKVKSYQYLLGACAAFFGFLVILYFIFRRKVVK